MTKPPKLTDVIEKKRQTINEILSDPSTHTRLIDMHWIRDELSAETKILFQYPDYMPQKEKKMYLDFSNIKNLGLAWDHIVKHMNVKTIDNYSIRQIHTMLCKDTDIPGGQYRLSEAHIMQLGINAPNYQEMLYRMDDVEYHMKDKRVPVLNRAFNIHYDIIAAQPFNDYNKRTARLIMNWFLISNGYRPILFNKRTDHDDYMKALRARANGDTKTYSHYMYSCMIRTQREIIKRLRKSKIL